MVDATILHLKQLRQAQQHTAPHSCVASAWLKVKAAARWVGDFCFPLPVYFLCVNFAQPKLQDVQRPQGAL
jgi:hypothetical protein